MGIIHLVGVSDPFDFVCEECVENPKFSGSRPARAEKDGPINVDTESFLLILLVLTCD